MSELDGASVLVTGATGFIGGRLALRLMERGIRPRLYVRDRQRLSPELQQAEIYEGDLVDSEAMARAVKDVDWIFHCAANVHTWDTWASYKRSNVDGVATLLNAISTAAPGIKRLIHVSTVDVYGFPVEPCDENGPADGGEFGYGQSKWLGESLVRSHCEAHNIPYAVIRPGNVIGPGSQFVSRVGAELKGGLMLKVDGGHHNAGLVYIDNLIDYMFWAAVSPEAFNQCYNVRDAYDVTWAEFLSRLKSGIGGHGLVISLPFGVADRVAKGFEWVYGLVLPAHEPLLHRLLVRLFGRTCGHSADKIRRHSGMTGKVSFEQAMAKSATWFKERPTHP